MWLLYRVIMDQNDPELDTSITSLPMENIIHELRYEESTAMREWDRRPMQALFIGNDYAKQLGEALQIHFNRYERNETEPFGYVKELNLIGNLFDDDGVEAIANALDHPYSYTDSSFWDETPILEIRLLSISRH